MQAPRRPRGFSLTELLVCVSLVVVLATLLGPAILRAQATSGLNRCKNNLKNIGLACANYHDSFGSLPPGWVTKNRDSSEIGGNGWQLMLLPYLDQAQLFYQITFNTQFNASSQKDELKAFHTGVKVYRCPDDPTPSNNPAREGWPTSNYSGNGGHRPFPRWSALPGKCAWPGAVTYPSKAEWSELTSGLFFANSSCGFRAVKDGLSNTILVGERSAKSGAGIWPGLRKASLENDAITEGSHASRLQKSVSGFSSPHEDVCFLLGDGSVRGIRSNIDSQPNTDPKLPLGIFQRLMCRNDGQEIPDF